MPRPTGLRLAEIGVFPRNGDTFTSAPIVTTLEPARPQGVSVPFVGLAEAYIVAAFTKAGVPMRRIRPAVLWLQEHNGLTVPEVEEIRQGA